MLQVCRANYEIVDKGFSGKICCIPTHGGIIGIPESSHENIETEENIKDFLKFPLKHSAEDQKYIICTYRLKDR